MNKQLENINTRIRILNQEITNIENKKINGGYSGNDRWRDHQVNFQALDREKRNINDKRELINKLINEKQQIILDEKLKKEEEKRKYAENMEIWKNPVLSLK